MSGELTPGKLSDLYVLLMMYCKFSEEEAERIIAAARHHWTCRCDDCLTLWVVGLSRPGKDNDSPFNDMELSTRKMELKMKGIHFLSDDMKGEE